MVLLCSADAVFASVIKKIFADINFFTVSKVVFLFVFALFSSYCGQTISACNNGKLLELKEVNETGEPVYTMCPIKKDGQDILPNKTFETNRSSENCWQLQIGIRYIFN